MMNFCYNNALDWYQFCGKTTRYIQAKKKKKEEYVSNIL